VRLAQILEFFFHNSPRNVYAGERDVRPPGAPTTERGGAPSALTSCRAVSTGILHLPARVVVTTATIRHRRTPRMSSEFERRQRTADDHPHGSSSAALRSPASGSRPTHGEREYRLGSRSPSLDGPWMARAGTEGRGGPRRDGFESAGTPARNPEAPATREEAQCATSARAGPASKLGVHVDARAPAQRRRHDQDPARRGSGPRVCAVADAPAVPATVTESVPCLATAPARVCA
jgi:hypothetical protein